MPTAAKPQNITPDQKSFGARILICPHAECAARRGSNRQAPPASMARMDATRPSSSTGSRLVHHLHCRRLAAWNVTGEKLARIHRQARTVDGGAEATGRGPQAQDRDRRSQARAPRLGGSARRRARGDAAGFLAALEHGYNINVATTTLDPANARIFASFTRGGGMGLDEMTGSPNLTIVPDPSTFRVLPGRRAWAGCCATNISPAACRFTSRRGNCCAARSSG